MTICHICRAKLPSELTVNICLRDGAVEMAVVLERMKTMAVRAAAPLPQQPHCLETKVQAQLPKLSTLLPITVSPRKGLQSWQSKSGRKGVPQSYGSNVEMGALSMEASLPLC